MGKGKEFIVVVDFDGTLTTGDSYPAVGELNMEAINVLHTFKADGCTIIINTCRDGQLLQDAKNVLDLYAVPYDYVNENSKRGIEFFGHDTRKICGDVYIDDRNLGGLPPWSVIYNTVALTPGYPRSLVKSAVNE